VLEFLREARPGRAVCSVKPLEPYLETATALVGTVEGRDSIDTGHAVRVGTHCASIADFLGLGAEETQALLYAASVHDIGKIGITPELLAKPSLSEADRKVMKFHPRRGAELIRALTPYAEAADVVHYHHERPDGTGYYGRTPDQVPALARVLAVADVFDGMTFSRHGTTLGAEEAVERLREGSGKSYDADCVEALASAVRPARVSIPVSAQPTLFRS
jgi:HD-GYP domain-containing protein (c-di-GMP phosphodiesterase class II)